MRKKWGVLLLVCGLCCALVFGCAPNRTYHIAYEQDCYGNIYEIKGIDTGSNWGAVGTGWICWLRTPTGELSIATHDFGAATGGALPAIGRAAGGLLGGAAGGAIGGLLIGQAAGVAVDKLAPSFERAVQDALRAGLNQGR